MKIKIDPKGFIQIPLLIAIVVSVAVISVGGYGGFEYYKTSKIIKESEQLTKEEKYNEAIEKLELLQNNWFIKNLGIKKQTLITELEKTKKLFEDKTEYLQGIEEFNKENWEKAKELLSKVSEASPHYQDAKNKIDEAQQKLTQKQISEAIEKATKETLKKGEEVKRGAEETQKKIEDKQNQGSGSIILEKITPSEIQPYLTGVGEVLCYGLNYKQGSGSLWKFGNKYFVLTNKHVIPVSTLGCDFFAKDLKGHTIGVYNLDNQNPFSWNSRVDAVALEIISPNYRFSSNEDISDLNYKISSLPYCNYHQPLGSPVVIMGFPAFSEQEITFKGYEGRMNFLTITEGVINSHDTSVKYFERLPDVNYFVSAKIDAGNSGGIALSKNENGQLCVLGIPTWISLGKYETQGLVQSIHNVTFVEE